MENVKSYYCNNCGAIMEFDIASQGLKCPNCGNEIEIEVENSEIVEHDLTHSAKTENVVQEKESTSMQCEGCGAIVEVDPTSMSTECPYCGSNYVLAEKQIDTIIPDGIVPFQITKQDVGRIFEEWIGGRKLAPSALKGLYESNKIQGIYIPYWTFDANVNASYTAMGGTEYEVTRTDDDGNEVTETKVRWSHTSGSVRKFFDDILIKASDKLPGNLSNSLKFNTQKLVPYSPDYMSGYNAEIYTLGLEDAQKQAVKNMENRMESMCREDVLKRYDKVKDVRASFTFSEETYKYVLLPIYSTSYVFNNEHYNVIINGQSGKLEGEYPKDKAKIAAIVIFVILVIAIIIYFMSR